MRNFSTVLSAAIIAVVFLGSAYAVEPAYTGPMGNPEEPALRPYKGVWRGLKALTHQSVESLKQGNAKMPVLGSVELCRGVRRGAVELATSTYMGMAGSLPKKPTDVSKPNIIIENDFLLRNVADAAPTAVTWGAAANAAGAMWGSVCIVAAQQVVDHSPCIQKEDSPKTAESAQKRAQREYIGARADENKKPHGTGNLLKSVE